MKQFLEKERQISAIQSIVNKITKMLDEAEKAKKNCEQINRLKKEIRKETDSSIGITKKEILELLEKINREKWIIGEYKWMPIGSCMPEGWFKVTLAKGHTLVEGDELGIKLTSGMAKKHSHYFDENQQFAASYYRKGKSFLYNLQKTGEADVAMGVKDVNDIVTFDNIAFFGEGLGDNNLAAGMYAELWQYKGIDYKKKCFNLCAHRYMSELIDKFENCKKDQMKLEFLESEEHHRGTCG